MKEVNKSQEIKELILKTLAGIGVNVAKIFLFGSRAREDFDEESDYDILVILKEDISIEEKRELMIKVSMMLHKEIRLTPFDIIVKSLKDFEKERDVVNTISRVAFLEGVEI